MNKSIGLTVLKRHLKVATKEQLITEIADIFTKFAEDLNETYDRYVKGND